MIKIFKKQNGFSLVELLVVLGIITLISTITVPLLRDYQKTVKLNNESRILATNIRLAQQLAISEQIIYNVLFLSDPDRYQIINSDTLNTIKTVNFDKEISINEISGFTTDTIQFNATGAAIETGYIVLVNTRNSTSTIEVKPSGYVQITN